MNLRHQGVKATFTPPRIGSPAGRPSSMREEPTRSLLLLDANPDERRLISAIAARANWSVVGAADEEMALALLQGPHGREVLSVLLGTWDAEKGPQLISTLDRESTRL